MQHEDRFYRWTPLLGMNGHEAVHIGRLAGVGFLAYGEITSTDNLYSPETSVRYTMFFDRSFMVQTATIMHLATGEMKILISKEPGRWEDGAGNAIPEFDGCLEIDSSFTKSSPIYRLGLGEYEEEYMDVISVGNSEDELYIRVDEQRYTCLELRSPELPGTSCFRFENLSVGYTEEIFTDSDGAMYCFADRLDDILFPRQ